MSVVDSSDDYLKLTTYLGERHRCGRLFSADVLCDLYERYEVATSIMLRGLEGFGLRHHLRTDHSLSLSEDLPLVSIAVDARAKVDALLPEVLNANPKGLVTLERARLVRGDLSPDLVPEQWDEATKLSIYVGRQERAYGMPAFVAICHLLRRRGITGASVFLGVDGTAHGARERARFFSKNIDVPVMVIAVGPSQVVERVLPELGALLERPLMTLERVNVCKRDGNLVETPPSLPGVDEHGMALWQKLMIYTSEATLHQGRPVHRAITRELRSAGLSGATTLRGIWGFHGDRQPHGDRLVQLGRHVPALTIVIDTPDQVARAFAIIDELTEESGLVTSETIPAMRSASGARQRGGLHLASHHLK